MPVFFGASTHVVDEKRRITIPKRFFDHIAPTLDADRKYVLTLGPDGCILMMPKDSWEKQVEDLAPDYFSEQRDRDRRRLLVGFAEDGTPDRAARLFLPEVLRDIADIGATTPSVVVLQGMGEVIEIWSTTRWNERIKGRNSDFAKLFERIPATAGPTVAESRP